MHATLEFDISRLDGVNQDENVMGCVAPQASAHVRNSMTKTFGFTSRLFNALADVQCNAWQHVSAPHGYWESPNGGSQMGT